MKIRPIWWYRKEDEMFSDDLLITRTYILLLFQDKWEQGWVWLRYSCLDPYDSILTREEFEKDYLEWKTLNEG